MLRRAAVVVLVAALGCREAESAEAGVGGDRQGCEEPGSHSVKLAEHSCACEPGYAWCSEALDDFDCCAIEDAETDEGGGVEPEQTCDEDAVEQLACVLDPEAPEDPGGAIVWACNGERWVEVPNYATFACMAEAFPFAYGCWPGASEPEFLCGHGQGSACDVDSYGGVCVDEEIIDTCVWGRRTVDRCSRLCGELEVYGPGFDGGACEQPDPELPATCVCQ